MTSTRVIVTIERSETGSRLEFAYAVEGWLAEDVRAGGENAYAVIEEVVSRRYPGWRIVSWGRHGKT